MSKLAAFLGANSGPVLGAGALFVGAVGAGAYLGVFSPKDAVLPVPQEVAMPLEEPPIVEAAVAKPVVDVTPEVVVDSMVDDEPVVLAQAPTIDEVRSEADGLTVLAGRGEPGADVTLFVNDVENTTVQVGRDGAFAIVAFLEASPNAQVLSVIQRVGDIELATADIVLAPQTVVAQVVTQQPVIDVAVGTDVKVVQPRVIETANVAAAAVEPVTEPAATPAALVPVTAAVVEPAPKAASVLSTTEVAILKSDEDGVQIINRSSAPEVMSNVEIDTISYSELGDVLLSGRAQSAATLVRVYLDNTAVTTLDVDTSGRWRGDLPDVDTGIYTLRVDEVDDQGAVTSRVETPFKRESPEVLAATGGTDDAPAKAITVQTGTTLWAIARERYGDGTLFVRVFEANADSIKDANLIYPGQVFDLPD